MIQLVPRHVHKPLMLLVRFSNNSHCHYPHYRLCTCTWSAGFFFLFFFLPNHDLRDKQMMSLKHSLLIIVINRVWYWCNILWPHLWDTDLLSKIEMAVFIYFIGPDLSLMATKKSWKGPVITSYLLQQWLLFLTELVWYLLYFKLINQTW